MGVTNGLQIGDFICYRVKSVTFFFPKFLCLYLVSICKSFLELFIELRPNTDHRCCIRHMHANLKNNRPTRKTLKEIMWDTKWACKKNKHACYTDRINSISNKVRAFLFEFDARVWHSNVNLSNVYQLKLFMKIWKNSMPCYRGIRLQGQRV